MKNSRKLARSAAIAAVLAFAAAAHGQTLLDSSITYQGQLSLSGAPLNDSADFRFSLWDDPTAGAMIGSVVSAANVSVVNGVFTVDLDFGASAFNGDGRWVEVLVRSPAGSGAYTTLTPRQPLTAAPYSLHTRGIFVNSLGNVGIGTTAPGAKLGVAGELRVQSKVTSSQGNLVLSGGGAGVRVLLDEDGGSSDFFDIYDTGVLRFRVDGNTGGVLAQSLDAETVSATSVQADGITCTGPVRMGSETGSGLDPTLGLGTAYEGMVVRRVVARGFETGSSIVSAGTLSLEALDTGGARLGMQLSFPATTSGTYFVRGTAVDFNGAIHPVSVAGPMDAGGTVQVLDPNLSCVYVHLMMGSLVGQSGHQHLTEITLARAGATDGSWVGNVVTDFNQ